jgi:hypothetical protein
VKKVIIGIGPISVLAGVAVVSAVVLWNLPAYESNQHAVSIAKNKPQSIDLSPIATTVMQLKDRIDYDIGDQQMDLLSSGNSNAWQTALQDNELVQGPTELQSEIAECKAPDGVQQKLQLDVANLKALYKVASQEYNSKDYTDGAQALKYYHRVTEDINFYITQLGEHYAVSHILGGYQTVENFIHNHLN